MDCYVFLCRYFVINEESDVEEEEGEILNENEQDDNAAQVFSLET